MEAPHQREVYGEAPPSLLFALTVLAAIVAVLLFALGHWVLGLVAVAACALLASAFATSNRHARRAWTAWRLHRQRKTAIRILGEATYRDDEPAVTWARQQLAWLDYRLQNL